MIKIILLLLVCFGIVYVGYMFTKQYKIKLIIFNDLIKLCETVEAKIKLNKLSIKDIIESQKEHFCKEFSTIVDNYYYKQNFDYASNYLNAEEEKVIKDFFRTIGKLDVDGEINNIKINKDIFNSKYRQLLDNKPKGQLGIKLGVLFGLIILVIFI